MDIFKVFNTAILFQANARHIFLTPAWLSESEYNIIVHVITILKFTATIFFFVSFSLTRSYKKRVMIQKGLTKRRKKEINVNLVFV